ncbi:hypothetical protein M422DRAFT_271704 [Sphaerobolus stellatus SS14]|uniref:Zn(2)-C6 fungal-type domain-containing protein n=1 Tax=Sphaerobolus stellatus (strain SS14) TaxID=990650 RepID=A0A0C9UP94_SPHS4|nr:hypothetical protein M422DRAFT_271704 [Sphaerobolus stellatus SS14]
MKEVAMPVASGSGKGKGKSKEVVQDTDFGNKAICVFTHPTAGKKMSCDRCVRRKVNCTFQNPYEWAMHGALRTVNRHIKGLKAEAEDRNTLAGEELYHKYNLQQLESLHWAHSAFMEVVKLDIGLRELELKLKVQAQLHCTQLHFQYEAVGCLSEKKRSRDDKDAAPGSSKKARVEDEVVGKEGQGSREEGKKGRGGEESRAGKGTGVHS